MSDNWYSRYFWPGLTESAVRIELGSVNQTLQASQNWIFIEQSIYLSHFDHQLFKSPSWPRYKYSKPQVIQIRLIPIFTKTG